MKREKRLASRGYKSFKPGFSTSPPPLYLLVESVFEINLTPVFPKRKITKVDSLSFLPMMSLSWSLHIKSRNLPQFKRMS